MTEVEIFTKRGCGWAVRNYAALIEKGVPFRTVMSTGKDGHKTADFTSVSPYGRTPALRFGREVVWESAVMNEFIDERFPDPPLRPADPAGRAASRLWIYHCDGVLIPALNALARARGAGEAVGSVRGALTQLADWWVRRPRQGTLWRGERLSLVDIAFHTGLEALEAVEGLASPALTLLPKELAAWKAAISAHPSIKAGVEIARRIDAEAEAA